MSADPDLKTQAAESEPQPRPEGSASRFPPPQLRLHDRQVYVGFGATPLADGLVLADLALIVPEVTFPFDIAGSAATRYQKKKCRFGYLDLQLDHEHLHRAVRRIQEACAEHIATLRLHLRQNLMEGEGLLHAPGKPAPFSFRVGFQPEGTAVIACVYDVRLYGPAPLPAAFLAALLGRAAARAAGVPDSKPWGAIGIGFDPVPPLLRKAVPLRGFRLPDMDDARLARVEPGPNAFHLHFAANARADLSLDPELLTSIEGSRSFRDGEALLAQGDLSAAEAFYLRHGESPDSHPFAQERLLTLLAARHDAWDLALDVAAGLRRSRPGSAASYWTEATIRLARGESRQAGELFLKLGDIARGRGEEAAAFLAFAAAGRALAEPVPAKASRAFQDALVFRPDDLDSLLALASAADRAADHEGAMRAYRRIAALARDPAQAARAHVRLGVLLLELTDDRAAARLHFDAALRLVPDDPEALVQLASLCRLDGEHLRALRHLDQLRAVAQATENAPLEARSCLLAGAVWDEGLAHTANALLRYQEAVALAPDDCEAHLRLAGLLERLGRAAEALESYRQVVVLAEGRLSGPGGEGYRAAAHRANHSLARLTLEKLEDRAGAIGYWEAALALVPDDVAAMRALLEHFRAGGRKAELARALERCAQSSNDTRERAAMLAEAGELLGAELGAPEKAVRLLEQAILLEPGNRRALAALASLAEARGDGAALCRHLLRLVELAREPAEKAALLQRLARGARDVASDLDLAADALARALALQPDDLASRGELCALHRRRGDEAALAAALSDYASALEAEGEFAQAAAALRELAGLDAHRLGKSELALERLEHALVLAPEAPEILLDLGDLSLAMARPAAAREAFRSLLTGLAPDADPERVLDLKLRLARACDALGEREEAIAAYSAVFASRPADDAVADRLDVLLAEAERPRERAAARMSRAAARAEAGLGVAAAVHYRAAGELFEKLGEKRSARSAFEACLEADPDGPQAPVALDALAEAALAAREESRACELIARRAAFEGDPRASARLLFKAAGLARRERTARHQALLAEAAGRDARFPPARAALAELRLAEGEHAQALAHAEVALSAGADPDALGPKARAALERLAAGAARELEDYESARRHLSAYCEAEPGDLEALGELAGLLRQLGEHEPLIEVLGKLGLCLDGERAGAALRERAALLGRMDGRRDEAVESWRDALELLPDDPQSLEGLAGLLLGRDDAPERARLLSRLAELTREPERRQRLLFDSAEALLEAEQYAEAAEAFAQSARVGGRPAAALDRLAQAAALAGDDELELDALRQRAELAAREAEPDAAERFVRLGERLVALDEPDEAVNALSRSVELRPSVPVERDALVALVELHEAAGERAEAASRLARLTELLKGGERAAALVRRAEHLRALGEPESAREAASAALEALPGDRRAILLTKALCAELGDQRGYADALAALLRLPARDRKESAALAFELGELLLRKLDDPAGAEAALRRSLAWDPERFEAGRSLFELLVARDALEVALPLGESLAQRVDDPRKACEWFLSLERLASKGLGDTGLALRYARLAFERDRSDARAADRLADALWTLGSVREALPLHRRLAASVDFESAPERARQILLRTAELSLASGDRARAVGALRSLLEVEPTCAPAADLLYEALLPDDPAGAVQALARHARALAAGGRAWRLLLKLAGEARERLGSPALAAELLEAARPSAEALLPLELARVEALREAGNRAALAEALQRIADLGLEDGEPVAARQALDELADLLVELGDFERAAAALAHSADLCLEGADNTSAAERLRRRGALLQEKLGNPNAAETSFRRAFQLDPEDLEAAQKAAGLCALRDDAGGEAELIEAYAPLLVEPQARAAALVRLARLRLSLDDSAPASSALDQALQLQPAHAEARELFEELLAHEGRFGELASSLLARAAIAADAASRVALLRKAAGLWRDRVGDLDAAAQALLEARRSAAEDVALADECAVALEAAGRTEEAADVDAALLARDPRHERAFARRLAHLQQIGDDEGRALLLEVRAGREEPKDAARLLLEAAALRESLGHLSDAEADEQRAFELDPANDRAFAMLVAVRGNKSPEALAQLLLKRAGAVPAEAAALHRTRAQVLAAAGQADAAVAALDDALAIDGEQVEALALRADLAEERSGLAEARPFDERLLVLAGRGAAVPRSQSTRASYRAGLAAFAAGDDAHARERLAAAVELEPGHGRAPEALAALAQLYARSGEREKLYEVCLARARLLGSAPERSAALRAAVDAAPDVEREIVALRLLTEAEPSELPLHERLAAALAAAGRPAEQATALERAAQRAPAEHAAQLLLRAAAVLRALGQLDQARALRARAHESDPSSLDALRAVIEDLREAGEPSALASALSELGRLSTDPDERARTRLERARALDAVGDPRAAAAWASVVRAGPDAPGFAEAWERAGELFCEAEEFREAAEVFVAAAEAAQDAGTALGLFSRAATLLDERASDAEAALELLARAAGRAPLSPEPHATRAALFARLGRSSDEAAALLEQARRTPAGAARAELSLRAARLLAGLERADEALVALREATQSFPEGREARIELAALCQTRGLGEEALENLLAARALFDGASAERVGIGRRAAQLALELGREMQARELFGEVLDREPHDDAAYRALRALAGSDAHTRLALLSRRETVLRGDGEAGRAELLELLCERGELLAGRLDQADEAEQAWRAALELAPKHLPALTALRESAERRGDAKAQCNALEAEAAAVDDLPRARELLRGLARLASERLGDHGRAVEALERAGELAEGVELEEIERALTEELLLSGAPARALELLEELLESKPGDQLQLRARAADAREQLGDRAGARAELLLALELAPTDEALFGRIEKLAGDEAPADLARAAGLRASAVDTAADKAELLWREAQAWRRAEDRAAEVAALRATLAADPGFQPAFERQAELLRAGDEHAALRSLLESHAEHTADPEERARRLFEAADLAQGPLCDLEGARLDFERGLSFEPTNEAAAEALAEVLDALGLSGPEAHAELEAGPARPAIPTIALHLAELCEKTGRDREALAHFEHAALRLPSSRPALEGRLRVAEKLGDAARALDAALALLSTAEGSAAGELHLKACEHLTSLGRRDEALGHLESAALLDAGGPEAIKRLSDWYLERESWGEGAAALTWYSDKIEEPAERLAARKSAARLYFDRVGDLDNAASVLARALEESPDDAELLVAACQVNERRGAAEALVSAAERLEKVAGAESLAPFVLPLGRALQRISRPADALARLREALAREYDEPLADDVAALAEQLGDLQAFAAVELSRLERLPEARAGEAADRLRSLAGRLEEQEPVRAAELLERAWKLAGRAEDLERQATLLERDPASAPRALAALALLARQAPLASEPRERLATAAESCGARERARLLRSIDAFFTGATAPRHPELGRVDDGLRERLYEPLALGAVARLLRAAQPALGSAFAFPARLPEAQPVRLTSAPRLFVRLQAAKRAVGLEAVAALLVPGRVDVALEPGTPDRLLVGTASLARAEEGALAFQLLRACELSLAGYAVASLAGAAGLGDLVRSVACAAGLPVEPAVGLQSRLPALKAALAALGRADLGDLARAALDELDGTDPQALLTAIGRSASRVSLVVLGDAAPALRAATHGVPDFAAADPEALDPMAVAEKLPELRDEILTCLRDDLEALRAAATGTRE